MEERTRSSRADSMQESNDSNNSNPINNNNSSNSNSSGGDANGLASDDNYQFEDWEIHQIDNQSGLNSKYLGDIVFFNRKKLVCTMIRPAPDIVISSDFSISITYNQISNDPTNSMVPPNLTNHQLEMLNNAKSKFFHDLGGISQYRKMISMESPSTTATGIVNSSKHLGDDHDNHRRHNTRKSMNKKKLNNGNDDDNNGEDEEHDEEEDEYDELMGNDNTRSSSSHANGDIGNNNHNGNGYNDQMKMTSNKRKRMKSNKKEEMSQKIMSDMAEDIPQWKESDTPCNCKKSNCLKLYCECFNNKTHCGKNCACFNCKNRQPDKENWMQAYQKIILKNPNTFQSKEKISTAVTCTCKNTKCIKKYCECFRLHMACNAYCKCVDCENSKPQSNHPSRGKPSTPSTNHIITSSHFPSPTNEFIHLGIVSASPMVHIHGQSSITNHHLND